MDFSDLAFVYWVKCQLIELMIARFQYVVCYADL